MLTFCRKNTRIGQIAIPLFSIVTGEALLLKALSSAVIASDEKERIMYYGNKLTSIKSDYGAWNEKKTGESLDDSSRSRKD